MTSLTTLLVLIGQGWATGDARLEQGRGLFEIACAACHGADGRGNRDWEGTVKPLDLADCATTAERADHWQAIVARGGARFGLSSVMPSFGETLTEAEIAAAVAYTRTLCAEADRYPPGELNPRRLLSTLKAFPETEVRIEASHALDRTSRTLLHVEVENRVGSRFQFGVGIPIRPQSSIYDELAGVGNVELELKRVLAFLPSRGLIASMGLEVETPTGSLSRSLGTGTWVWKPFAAISRSSGRMSAQAHALAELPADTIRRQDRQLLYSLGVSYSLGPPRSAWTPGFEVVGTVNRRRHFWRHEVLLEVSRPISRLGHVVAAAGLRIPTRRFGPVRLEGYVLWDFSEGPPWRGF